MGEARRFTATLLFLLFIGRVAGSTYMVTFAQPVGCEQSKLLDPQCSRVRKCYGRRILVDMWDPCEMSELLFTTKPLDIQVDGVAAPTGAAWFVSGPNGVWASDAWAKGSNGSSSVIGVIDTGLWSEAVGPGWIKRVVPGYDFCSSEEDCGDGDGRDVDFHEPQVGHGTLVSLSAAAVATGAGIMPLRVLYEYASASDIADAIVYSTGGFIQGLQPLEAPVTAVSISLGSILAGRCPDYLQSALDEAAAKNIPVFVAAGNQGLPATAFWPSNCRDVISVGNSDENGRLAPTSNTHFDIAAPGTFIIDVPNGAGGSMSAPVVGTSFSTPVAAAAFVLGMDPAWKGREFLDKPSTMPWNYLHEEQCVSNGIVSFKGIPTTMRSCMECEDVMAKVMHYAEDYVSVNNSFAWVLMVFWVVVLGWFVCMVGAPWLRDSEGEWVWRRRQGYNKVANSSPKSGGKRDQTPESNEDQNGNPSGGRSDAQYRSIWNI